MTDAENKILIDRAEQAVREVAKEFNTQLKQRVYDLENAMSANDSKEAAQLAYNLESEAETFGWPLVTRICKWLRKINNGDYDRKPTAEEILVTLNTLKLMVNGENFKDLEQGLTLFSELHPVLKNVISDS